MVGWLVCALFFFMLVLQPFHATIRLVMRKPTQAVLRAVYTKNVMDFEFVIAIDEGNSPPRSTVICTTEINPTYDLNGDIRKCVASGTFSMKYFHSGTRLTNVTLESHHSTPGSTIEEYTVLDSMLILQDLVLRPETDAGFVRALESHLPTLSRLDYLFIQPKEQIRHSYSLGSFDYFKLGGGGVNEGQLQDPGRSLRVALFARQGAAFSASDRILDWICEHDAFRQRGISLSVITPSPDGDAAEPSAICGVPVTYFPCLAEDRASTLSTEDLGLLLKDPSIAALVHYLSRQDALLVVNTFGDPQTSLLLDVVQALREAQTATETIAGATPWHSPLVIMDLPNIGLPDKWHGKVDGFIAPSRAVALHPATVRHGVPTAVVYPPVRDLVRQRSLCQGGGPSESGIQPVSLAEAEVEAVLPGDKFNILFVGRLAMVKAPGLLIRALGNIMAEDRLTSLGSEGQGDGLQDFAREVRVTFLGEGRPELVQALRALAEDLGLQGMVDLDLGHQTPERVVAFMQQAQVLVNPRTTGETFGFIHIEAAAQGLPVIAFDVCANAESLQCFHANASDSCTGVQSALLPLREESVVEDLALALLRAFVQHKSARECAAKKVMPQQCVAVDGAPPPPCTVPDRDAGRRVRHGSTTCHTARPLFERWNSAQHAAALAEALQLFLS